MTDPADFIESIAAALPSAPLTFKLARVSALSGAYPRLIFDGETVATTLNFPYLDSYTATVGDRVLVAITGLSGVVLGKVH